MEWCCGEKCPFWRRSYMLPERDGVCLRKRSDIFVRSGAVCGESLASWEREAAPLAAAIAVRRAVEGGGEK